MDPAPETYISIRINWAHADFETLRKGYQLDNFCAYPHLGKERENPHWHICVPVEVGKDANKERDKYSMRAKRALGCKGNKDHRYKVETNTVLKFIQYASKEETTPIHSGWDQWIENAPKWEPKQVQTTINKRKTVDEDHFRMLTYQNYKKAALRHRLRYNLKSTDMAEIHAHMIQHDNWDYNISVKKGGIPDVDYIHFEMMCKGEKDIHQRYTKRMRYTPQFMQ